MTSAPKTEEPVDEYAATVVLDEHAMQSGQAETTGETLTGDYVQDIEAALRSELRR